MGLGERRHSCQSKPGNSESANCGSKKGGTAGELLPALVPTVEQSDCGTVNHVVDLKLEGCCLTSGQLVRQQDKARRAEGALRAVAQRAFVG